MIKRLLIYLVIAAAVFSSVRTFGKDPAARIDRKIDNLRITQPEDLSDSTLQIIDSLFYIDTKSALQKLHYLDSILPVRAYRARIWVKHYYSLFDFDNRYARLGEAYQYAKLHDLDDYFLDYYISRSSMFFNDQAYDSSMSAILKARNLSLQNNGIKADEILHNIGDIFYDLGLYRNAEDYYKQALESSSRQNPPSFWRNIVLSNNLALILIENEDYQGAIDLFRKYYTAEVRHLKTYRDSTLKCYLNRKIALCLLALDSEADSIGKMLEFSIEFSAKHALNEHLIPSYFSYIRFLMKKDQPEEVHAHLSELLSLFPGESLPEVYLADYLSVRGEIYEYFGETKKALRVKDRYIKLVEKDRLNEKVASILQMLTDQDYTILEENYKLIHWQRNVLVIGTLLIVILLVIIIIFFQRARNLNRKLTESNHTKDKLFSIISHDLRSPIASFIQFAELKESEEDVDEERMAKIEKLQKESISNAYDLLENLLAWVRSNRNQISFRPTPLQLRETIEESMRMMHSVAHIKGITLRNEADEAVLVDADYEMLKFIIRNLGNNALKFTAKGGEIRITAVEHPDKVEVRFSDTGTGMTEEVIRKVLSDDEFYSTKGTQHETGSGIGLKLVSNFIEKHQGELRIESTVGKGSTFLFELPKP